MISVLLIVGVLLMKLCFFLLIFLLVLSSLPLVFSASSRFDLGSSSLDRSLYAANSSSHISLNQNLPFSERRLSQTDLTTLRASRSHLRSCQDGMKCTVLREQIESRWLDYYLHHVDVMERHLLLLREHVEASQMEKKEEVLNALDIHLDELEKFRSRASSLGSYASRREIKSFMEELRIYWSSVQNDILHYRHLYLAHEFSFLLDRAYEIKLRLTAFRDDLEKRGGDYSRLFSLFDAYSDHVSEADRLYISALQNFKIRDLQSLHEGRRQLRGAHSALSNSHQDLQSLRQEMIRLGFFSDRLFASEQEDR